MGNTKEYYYVCLNYYVSINFTIGEKKKKGTILSYGDGSTNNVEQSNDGTDLESGNIKIFTIWEKKKKGKIYPIVRL